MIINHSSIYTIGEYRFVNFSQLDNENVEHIRKWRNDPTVRNYMYNSEEISHDEHIKFIHSLISRKDKCYWLVYLNDKPLGVVSIVDIDYNKASGEIGYYLIPQEQNSGKGLDFLFTIYDFLFNYIGCELLFGRTEIHNINAIALNYYLGGQSSEQVVIFNGTKYVEFIFNKNEFIEIHKEKSNPLKLIKFLRQMKPQLSKIYNNN